LVQCNTNKCLKYSSIFQCGRWEARKGKWGEE
jgi:hypothetical protein